jgi:hypothetical protein
VHEPRDRLVIQHRAGLQAAGEDDIRSDTQLSAKIQLKGQPQWL